jgi:hypothetical protein
MPSFNRQGARAAALFHDVLHDPNLVALLPLNEKSGATLYDRCTRYRLPGTAAGNPTYSKAIGSGFYGLDLDGIGDYVSLGNAAALSFDRTSAFTLMALVNLAGTPSYAVDTATRADSAVTAGSLETGEAWTAVLGTWGIATNKLYCAVTDGGGGNKNVLTFDAGTHVGELSVAVTRAGGTLGLVVRQSDNANYIRLETDGSGTRLIKRVAGVDTTIGSSAANPSLWTKTFKVTMSGNDLNVYQDGALVIGPITDAFNNTATKHGLYVNQTVTDNRWDNVVFTGAGGDGGTILAKSTALTAAGWSWRIDGSKKPRLELYSAVANGLSVQSDTAVTNGTATLLGVTYAGTSAASGVIHYRDGVASADTDLITGLSATIVNSAAAQIGAISGAAGFGGDIAFVAVFDAVKTAQDWRRFAYLAGVLA